MEVGLDVDVTTSIDIQNMFLKGYPLEAKTAPKNWNQSVHIGLEVDVTTKTRIPWKLVWRLMLHQHVLG